MNAPLAQMRLWDALGSAGIAKDPQIDSSHLPSSR